MAVIDDLPAASKTTSEAIIDGLFAGVLGGFGMGALILVGEWLLGQNPIEVLTWFVPSGAPLPLIGGLAHLAVSGIYGLVFGWLWHMTHARLERRIPSWLLGILFGLVIFLLAKGILLPGNVTSLAAIPTWLLGLAHGVYGFILGWAVGRKEKVEK